MTVHFRLIAAAPDLLSALTAYPSQADGEDAYQFRERELVWWHGTAWPAIAKASASPLKFEWKVIADTLNDIAEGNEAARDDDWGEAEE